MWFRRWKLASYLLDRLDHVHRIRTNGWKLASYLLDRLGFAARGQDRELEISFLPS
ncbi:hypothetical protein PG2093B_1396 [Bifidobacterium pseudolongum subsp. globosum]|uniref:Uncharacterized protein n=1 Tax=Bifidobacterium pseudolongum subsp. globosum TaxID=1690 RepID=A0A4Q4ZYZ1_9BIFI|nr:hypothetical protein PG2093B_1396 [Bifidobacterium pseudolongum subsp. globosum]